VIIIIIFIKTLINNILSYVIYMPIHQGSDNIGPYFRYGWSGKKYHYNIHYPMTKELAYKNAVKQSKAIHASQSRKKFKIVH
jgi:hypothetical protein